MLHRVALLALVAVVVAVVGVAVPFGEDRARADGHERLQITIRNVTNGQPVTPAVVVVHEEDAVLLPSSAERLPGLEELAESGSNAALIETLQNRDGIKSVARFGGLVLPGEGASIQNIEAVAGDRVSVITMLACTNDALAVGTVIVPSFDALPAMGAGRVLDAGTEDNSEREDTIPCLGGEGVSSLEARDGEGEITDHPGIQGSGALTREQHGWIGPAIQIFLDRRGESSGRLSETDITIRNMTVGQPLTPPLVVVHDPSVNPFLYTRPSELAGIDDFSEGGVTGTLVTTLFEAAGVLDVIEVASGGPIGPQSEVTQSINAVHGAHISVASMFACTNDAYVVARVPVTVESDNVVAAFSIGTAFDSGAENNDETRATVPCLGGDSAALSPGFGEGTRREHPGVVGDADLDTFVHSWHPEGTMSVAIGGGEAALPATGGTSPAMLWLLVAGIAGSALVMFGAPTVVSMVRSKD